MEEQNQQLSSPVKKLAVWQKDLIVAAVIGLLCAAFILPIAQNLGVKQILAWSLFLVLPILAALGLGVAYWLGEKIQVLYQIAKFILVGALNTFVDWGILNLLMFLTSISAGVMFSAFKGASFLVSMTNSYFWNKFWTFKKTVEPAATAEPVKSGREALQFFIVSVVGFLLNVGIATFLVNILGPQFGFSPKLWANVGALAGTVLGMTWNFLGYKLIVFKS